MTYCKCKNRFKVKEWKKIYDKNNKYKKALCLC